MFDDMTEDDNSSKAQADIDANLRRAYDEVINQNVPERFRVLLDKLRAGDSTQSDNENAQPNETGDHEGENERKA